MKSDGIQWVSADWQGTAQRLWVQQTSGKPTVSVMNWKDPGPTLLHKFWFLKESYKIYGLQRRRRKIKTSTHIQKVGHNLRWFVDRLRDVWAKLTSGLNTARRHNFGPYRRPHLSCYTKWAKLILIWEIIIERYEGKNWYVFNSPFPMEYCFPYYFLGSWDGVGERKVDSEQI